MTNKNSDINNDVTLSLYNCIISLCGVMPSAYDLEKKKKYTILRDKHILNKERKEKLEQLKNV